MRTHAPGLALLLLTACAGSPERGTALTAATPPDDAPAVDACTLRFLAPARSTSDSRLPMPPEVYTRAMAPLVPALCACTHHGEQLHVEARVVPAKGEVRAVAPDDPGVDACLARQLAPGRFARDEDAASKPLRSVSSVALTVDREREQIRDERAPRMPTFEGD